MAVKAIISYGCLGALATTAALSQAQTNGLSLLGTLAAPQVPQFLTGSSSGTQCPWGKKNASNSHPYKEAPDTGVTRHYEFVVSRAQLAPDGYQKNMILVNGQFPGPLIQANWGDYIEVEVTNNIDGPKEGTSLHWHGLLQTATPWYDGTPGVQQCPIAPNSTFTYRFKADQYGTSWYHSHSSAQYTEGLLGPMIIHGPSSCDYDIDLGPVFISDCKWTRDDLIYNLLNFESTNQSLWRTYSDNNLINGKMFFNCSTANDKRPCENNAPVSKFKFQRGKSHRLRLINAGAAGQQFFSIDGHELTVIANDFVPINPYKTKTVFLGIGQRTDVVVHASGNPKSTYWMRSNISTICNLPLQPQALAQVYYSGANTASQPTSQPWPYTDNGQCANDDLTLTTPSYALTPSPNPAKTFTIVVDNIVDATGHLQWRLNHQPFHPDYRTALLLQTQQRNYSYPPEWNVLRLPADATTIRLVINNNSTISHPMHIHGHQLSILSDGPGAYTPQQAAINPSNPQRRDTQMLQPGGHLVVQYEADNPGVWPLHCHVAWHLGLGFYMNIIERADDIAAMQIPDQVAGTCADWNAYTATAGVVGGGSDSGP
ncbi:MAG: hypothetical protein Q9195_004647 [Heterodermia aff. obscurata]